MKTNKKRTNVFLNTEQLKELKNMALRKDVPYAYLIRMAIKEYIDREKDGNNK